MKLKSLTKTKLGSRLYLLWAVVLALVFSVPAVALADQVTNNVDATVDATAEVMSLQAGGTNGTTQLSIITQNGDGKNGCNLTSSTTFSASVNSSDPSVATVNPGSVTFTSCGDVKALTVTPKAQGTATISLNQTANTTGGTFDLAPAKFTVNVSAPPPSNTPPTVTVNGVDEGASYEKGSVPDAICQVTDAEDGNSSFAATLSPISGPLASSGFGQQTASCSYTDNGSLTASSSKTYNIVDSQKPTSQHSLSQQPNDAGWNNQNVTVSLSASDNNNGSGVKEIHYSASGAQTINDSVYDSQNKPVISSEGTTTFSYYAVDNFGNTEASHSFTVKLDKTNPSVQVDADRSADSNGWYNHVIGFTFHGTDATSGVANCDLPASYNGPDSATASVSGSCTDNAGNTGQGSLSFKFDNTAPNITDLGVSAGTLGSNGWYTSQVTNNFRATDGMSGFSNQTNPYEFSRLSGSAEEGNSVVINSGTVTDVAGNESQSVSSLPFKIDLNNPLLNVTDNNLASYNVCQGAPSKPTINPSDTPAGSGIDVTRTNASESWTTPNTASGVGNYAYSAQAFDLAGRSSAPYSKTYSVVYGNAFSGIQQPINPDGSSRFKVGSTIPVKFTLNCNGAPINNAVARLNIKKADSTPDAGTEEAISTAAATTGNSFRLADATTGQYIFNLSTKAGYTSANGTTITSFAQGTYTLSIVLDDGTYKNINIQLVK